MQPLRNRLICRAHNRFSPSIALWQHFVAPSRPLLLQQRLSSSTTEATQDNGTQDVGGIGSQEAIKINKSGAESGGEGQQEGRIDKQPQLKIKKKKTQKGKWFPTPVEASIAKNIQKSIDKGPAEHREMLATARAAFNQAEDYEGVVVKPIFHPKPVWEKALPWCVSEEEMQLDGIERLAIEIPKFHEYVTPSKMQKVARKHVIKRVEKHVQYILPKHTLEVFGSERTGLALATSDIDLRLISPGQDRTAEAANFPPVPTVRTELREDLQKLYRRSLQKHKSYILPSIRWARYPLISLQDLRSGLDVQIVLSNDTSASRKIMQEYMNEYPYLAQLHTLIKTMFDLRGLSDVFRGGFGSYSLFMMIVASLKHSPHPRNDAAGGFMNFLKFYSDFDTTKKGISIDPVMLFDKVADAPLTGTTKAKLQEGLNKPLPNYMLSLRDPADETNDLGRKGIAIKHVQATIKSLSRQLLHDIGHNNRFSILAPHVGPCFRLNEGRHAKLETFGTFLWEKIKIRLDETAKVVREAEKTTRMANQIKRKADQAKREDGIEQPQAELEERAAAKSASVQQEAVAEEVDLTEEPEPIVDTSAEGAKESSSV
ncbi:hypothetical protein P153DRAFT_329689 [Dothidotthia symphoricarpi CBS 119687]|uniref:Poly(A) RNA polymerase mitochondrial-like central palm domain-containing protein n=1 Tax=Dothidotthia symphoricarpi CBS 119687 TaxID=1392245 RepID=A0A6A6AVA0_9PLEO|nr:uncharacterized protein P153DRAFT_329689 [Dothidotthia symphoricarpi CBS 119687]KAF2134874.1 hypothetical protein P153DRAFT_329689 [Dothidotthia symphoricarpi CBS 119687]